MVSKPRFQNILGVRFIVGSANDAVHEVSKQGGLVVVPAAPALKNLVTDEHYREALLGADFAIADSVLMVLLWNIIELDNIPKLSGLKYLRALIQDPDFRQPGSTFWVMPNSVSARRNVEWLHANGIVVEQENVYLAPMYGAEIDDRELIERIQRSGARHIVLGVGGGTQERLGFYLKRNLSYIPAIHCIGAAIAFLSGDQVYIPTWADRFGLGWLLRILSDPKRFGPRYLDAWRLAPLMFRYRDRLPA